MELEELNKIKQDVKKALRRLDLQDEVSLNEIKKEISKVETSFQSLLILGILSRIMYRQDDQAANLFVPAITKWKNYLPCEDLGGLTPAEYMEKYPPGPYESRFIAELMDEYQKRLEIDSETGEAEAGSPEEEFDVETDFKDFQDEYLERIPAEQPFANEDGSLMTIKEIITEERRRNNRPEENIDKVGVKIFAENTAEGTGQRIAEIDDKYTSMLDELEKMRQKPQLRNNKRVHAMRKEFEKQEPYHRCAPEPHRFYCNFASVVIIDEESGEEMDLAKSLLERSLSYNPDYKIAQQIKKNLEDFEKE